MPTYHITSPDGQEFEVTGEGTEQDALAHIQAQLAEQPQAAPAPAAPQESTGAFLKRELSPANLASAAVRPLVKGVAAVPGIFADGAMGAWNLASGQNNQMPSAALNQLLDKYTRKPEGVGKVAEAVSSTLVGARTPMPKLGAQAPAGFVKPSPASVKADTLQATQKAGYVVPPATANPTLTNRMLETIGGKIATAQDAAIKNQPVTTGLAKKAIGVEGDTPLTLEAIAGIRKQAGDAYEVLRNVGDFSLDAKALNKLQSVAGKHTGSDLTKAISGDSDIPKIVDAIWREKLNGSTAVDAIGLLRDKATAAYAKGDTGSGKGYRELSNTLENAIERHLSTSGQGKLLANFKSARELIAKTYSVEKAFNPATGDVSGTKLAAQLTRGKPLTGELKLAAQFAQAFPKAAREILDSGSVRNTDLIVGGGTAALSGKYQYLLYPFIRQAVRAGLLTKAGQSLATKGAPMAVAPGAVMGAGAAGQQVMGAANDLVGQ